MKFIYIYMSEKTYFLVSDRKVKQKIKAYYREAYFYQLL